MARLLPLMMPSEATTNDLDWTRLQGTVLEGGFQLESILAADESEASFKIRVLGDSAASAFARVFLADVNDFKEQISAWERARQLRSRHLSLPMGAGPLGAGETAVEAASLAYVVLKRPDETLNTAIQERALSRQEAGDVLLAAVRGLDELHSHGLVHGCVSPDQIVADGDTIQLSTERVRGAGMAPAPPLGAARYRAPESGAANVTPEADVWCLGATLVEMLTQRRCGDDCMDAAAKLPPPFDAIARGCLDADPAARIKLGQVEALFRGRTAPLPLTQPTAVRSGVVAPASVPAREMAPPRRIAAPHEPKLRAWWLYAVAGVAVVLLAIWLFHPRRAQTPRGSQVVARTGTSPSQTQAQTPASAWESKTLTPEDGKAASRPQPAAPQPALAQPTSALRESGPSRESGLVKGSVWRLVLYTYTRQADADNKARWVNTKYPGLNAETFSPSGGSPYLVVAGGRMSRDDAVKLRQKARSLGLPRDAYIQNYQQ